MGLKERIASIVATVQRLKPVRVVMHFSVRRGPVLGSGLAYQALFAVFAGLWVAFSIAGLVVSGDTVLQDSLLRAIEQAVPGLIAGGSGEGAIDPDQLLSASVFGVTGTIALGGLLFLALGWLQSARDAVRVIFDLPPAPRNFALQKLIDLGLGLALGAVLVAAGGLSFLGTSASAWLLETLRIPDASMAGAIASRAVTLLVMVALYAVVLTGIYRILSGIRVPWRLLRVGVAIGAVGLGALTVLGTFLLGGASANPLIASFSVIAGLLLYFNFVCQVILVAAAWIAVGVADEDVVLDEKVAAQRLEEARRLVAANAPPEPAERGFWGRLFRRDRGGGRR